MIVGRSLNAQPAPVAQLYSRRFAEINRRRRQLELISGKVVVVIPREVDAVDVVSRESGHRIGLTVLSAAALWYPELPTIAVAAVVDRPQGVCVHRLLEIDCPSHGVCRVPGAAVGVEGRIPGGIGRTDLKEDSLAGFETLNRHRMGSVDQGVVRDDIGRRGRRAPPNQGRAGFIGEVTDRQALVVGAGLNRSDPGRETVDHRRGGLGLGP